MNVPAGSYLFKIGIFICVSAAVYNVQSIIILFIIINISGDPDENVFIVQNGKVNVFVTNQEGISISLKIVKTGDSLTSLLSFADVLTVKPKMCTIYYSKIETVL